MPDLKGIAKGGWHPKGKDGKSTESWRGDYKGINQVAGWVGKGKGPDAQKDEHISRPLSALKDPAAFGPPPKNVNYHGGAALPQWVLSHDRGSLSKENANGLSQITPDTRGLGAPLSKEELQERQRVKEEEEERRAAEETAKPPPPPRQYRVDTTGLSTANLPPPPGRKDGADGRNTVVSPPPTSVKPKPPSLPPRLPPRQNTNPATPPPVYTEQDAQKGILNQSSLERLSTAGLSVPGLGIKKQPPPSPSGTNASQLNELQSRFSRLSSTSSVKPENPSEGTTFAQKQAALKTASSFRNDPSSVSLNDARNAASTANNFRERHGDQVKTGWQSANKLNNKYGIANKVGAFGAATTTQPTGPPDPNRETTQELNGAGLGKKKPPPPPPPAKRPELTGAGVQNNSGPPPIPLSSKPKPSVSE